MNMIKVICNGLICDGSGNEPEAKDLLIVNNRIADIAERGDFADIEAEKIDAAEKIIAPGFIDAHAHGDTRKFLYPERRTVLLQGITTEVDGNCGMGAGCVPDEAAGLRWKDLDEYVKLVNDFQCSVNTVSLAGHNSIRRHVMGDRPDKATPDEIKTMQKILEKALSSGAAGWSSGLTYFPGKFADEDELKAFAEVTENSEKIYATHIRSEGDDLFNAVDEAVRVASAGSGRLQLSHLKTIFPRNYHKIDRLLEMIDAYRAKGIDIHADRYPYVYSSTRIGQVLPAPYDRIPDISHRLRESEIFQDEVTEALKNSPRDMTSTIIISANMTLAELAVQKGISIERVCMEILKQNDNSPAAYLCMSEDNLKRILAQPYVCAGTDGISAQLDDPASEGHPRAVGSIPLFYRMVKEMTSVGEAVRRMTSLPAEIYRIPERGLIRKNYIADLVVFDAEKLDSAADFSMKNLMPAGIDKVFVGGNVAWDAAKPEKIGRFGRFIAVN